MNTRQRLCAVIACLTLGLCAWAVAAEDPLPKLARDARVALDRQRTLARHHFNVGEALFDKGDCSAAKEEFRKALGFNPNHAAAAKALRRCDALLAKGDPPAAELLDRAVRHKLINRQRAMAQLKLRMANARKALRDGEFAEASDQLTTVMAIARWLEPHFEVDAIRKSAAQMLKRAERGRVLSEKLDADARRAEAFAVAKAREVERRKNVDGRISVLIAKGRELLRARRYDEARAAFIAASKLAPDNRKLVELIERTRQLGVKAEGERIARERAVNTELANARVLADATVQNELLVYPPEWGKTKGIDRRQREEEREEPWKAELRRKIEQPVTFDFIETPLEDVCRFLRELSDTDIILDPGIVEAARGPDVPVTLKVTDMPMSDALTWINRLTGTKYDLRDKAIYIATPQAMRGKSKVRIIDVKELRMPIRDFPGDKSFLSRAGLPGSPDRDNIFSKKRNDGGLESDEEFIKFLKAVIGPGEWIKLPGGRFGWVEGEHNE